MCHNTSDIIVKYVEYFDVKTHQIVRENQRLPVLIQKKFFLKQKKHNFDTIERMHLTSYPLCGYSSFVRYTNGAPWLPCSFLFESPGTE